MRNWRNKYRGYWIEVEKQTDNTTVARIWIVGHPETKRVVSRGVFRGQSHAIAERYIDEILMFGGLLR